MRDVERRSSARRWHGSAPPTRRRFLALTAGDVFAAVGGCLTDPSSGGPPYEIHEIDDGPVYRPGLQATGERAYFAALVTTEEGIDAFDLDRLPRAADREFLESVDFATELLGVIQVSGVPSTYGYRVPDVSLSDVNLTVIAVLEGDTPATADAVISTLLVRVTRTSGSTPDRISVELDVDGDHEIFSG